MHSSYDIQSNIVIILSIWNAADVFQAVYKDSEGCNQLLLCF